MDIIVFIIIVIVILFIYYLINVIKDLQLEIKNMSMKCSLNGKNEDSSNKPLETFDIKIKNDIVYVLDSLKNYFI